MIRDDNTKKAQHKKYKKETAFILQMKLTPAMKQYNEIKEQYPDCIVMFRMGDFYEMFYDDAKVSARVLGITLTARGQGATRAPLAGIPYHALDQYLKKLVKKGYKIAIVEQLEDPKKARGVVKRGVVRIITPGTVIEDSILSDDRNNYICSVYHDADFGLTFCDISTGEFHVTSCDNETKLYAELDKYSPSELIMPYSMEESPEALELKKRGFVINTFDDRFFWKDKAENTLKEHFGIRNTEGLGLKGRDAALSSSGGLLSYLQKTQLMSLGNIREVHTYSIEDYMILDSPTQKNLELVRNIRDNTSRGSLFEVINKTSTSMGTRRLKSWIHRPLTDIEMIEERLSAVGELKDNSILVEELKDLLSDISDLERIIGRITYGSSNARDLVSLKSSLTLIPRLKELLRDCGSALMVSLKEMEELKELKDLIDKSIKDEPAAVLKEGNIIKGGYSPELDELKGVSRKGKEWVAELEEQERKATGIKSLKVKFNKVFGYFIEVTKSNLSHVPEHYIRKQTQVNCERFITEELKEKESAILGAQDKINALEYELFTGIVDEVLKHIEDIQEIASKISTIDCLISFALTARQNSYVRPKVTGESIISLKDARHPVVERIEAGSFVGNDVQMDEDSLVHIITGPNMAGKSTYLRQVALIVLLAQVGSFVPADEAKIGIVDRIFSRVGAYDDLSMGQSTFMVEMSETANILNTATSRSLIIMDEVGRGTSTYDGLSLAWSIIEHIIADIQAKTLFATHYHHLNKLGSIYDNVRNFNVKVDDSNGRVIFLHKIIPGGTDKSYGIHVAELAGVPKTVIERAKVIMGRIENQEQLSNTITREEVEYSGSVKKEEEQKSKASQLLLSDLVD